MMSATGLDSFLANSAASSVANVVWVHVKHPAITVELNIFVEFLSIIFPFGLNLFIQFFSFSIDN
mgnify:CR=1 FL=1